MNKRYFLYFFVAIVLGICASALTAFSKVAILAVLPALLIFLKRKRVLIFLLVTVLSMTVTSFSYKEYTVAYEDITVTGTVEEVREGDDVFSLVVKNCRHGEMKNTKVVVHIYEYYYDTEIKEGNLVTFTGDAFPVKHEPINPGETPFSSLYNDIGYSFDADSFKVVDDGTSIEYLFGTVKNSMRKTLFSAAQSSDAGAVLYAMITGDRSYIGQDVADVFASCGTSHLLAVSGLHVGILLNLITYLFEKLRIRSVITIILLGVFVALYSAFTDFSSSVLRAGIMAMVHALSRLMGGKYDSLNSLGFAGCVILLFDPFRLFDVAFQMSFCACFGIAWVVGHTVKTKIKILNIILDAGAITVGATVFTLPLQLYYFGTVSLVSLLANILLVSAASFALMLAFLLIVPAMLWGGMAFLLKVPCLVIAIVVEISKMLANVPHFAFKPISLPFAIGQLVFIIFLTRFVHLKRKIKLRAVGAVLLVCTLLQVGITAYSSNFIAVNVPFLNDGALCTHIDGQKYYIVGLCSMDAGKRQINYVYRNTDSVEAVFIMNDAHMSALEDAVKNGLEFNALYVAPSVTMNKTARRYKARYISEAVHTKDGYFIYEDGLVFVCGGKEILVYDSGESRKKYDIAVTENLSVKAHTVISKGDEHRADYDANNGHVRIYIRRNQ